MTNNEINEAGEKFMAYLEANGVSDIYIAVSVTSPSDPEARLISTHMSGLNRFEVVGIAQQCVHKALRDGVETPL